MDMLRVAHGALTVARFATKVEGGRNVALGMARGVANASLRSEPAGIRMVNSVADEASRALSAHQASRGVQLVALAHDVVSMLRRA